MLYAMFAVVTLTYIIGIIALRARVNGVKSGAIKIKYFRTMQHQPQAQEESTELPEDVIKSTRQFNNLFETPVLFYVVGVLYLSLGIDSVLATYIAWIFVVVRVVHAYIHMGYNNVLHRMAVFWVSNLCILCLWINLLIVYSP